MSLPYNRALHPEDYAQLQPHLTDVQKGEAALREKSAPFRKDHAHREWEYANVLKQLRDLAYWGEIVGAARVLDTGFGANYFTPTLKTLGYNVEAMDSMHYGDCTPWLIQQCYALDIEVPLHVIPAGLVAMEDIENETYDVTLCISTIEHVDARDFDGAWSELSRVTKVGGYVMATTDYFRDLDAWHASKYKQIQHTPVTEAFLDTFLPKAERDFGLKVVGGVDLTYRGDWVDNYSFVNLCFQRVN